MTAKRLALGAVLLGSSLLSFARAESPTTLPKPTSYVSDFAGVIDDASKQNIEDIAWQVYSKAHATIQVVTVKSLDGQDIDSWTTALEDAWKVGPKASDRGILMVFSIQDHKDRIEVGYGLEGILPDGKVGDIRRSMHDDLVQGRYGPGIQTGVLQIANIIAADSNVTITPPQQAAPAYTYQPQHRGVSWVKIVFLIIFLVLIFHGGGRGGGGRGWLWFLLGNMMGGGFGGGRGGGGFGDGGGGGGGGGGDFGGGFGGGSGGGGASGDF